MSERKMATVRKILDIKPIPGADAIEVAVIDGWKVVVKKDEFSIGDLVVYCEIDSWIPFTIAPFLSKAKEPREYNGVPGERLRTVRLRGQISQGLILPIDMLSDVAYEEGFDCSEYLNIQKYEPPIAACIGGELKGLFPSAIRKTDQERIQNLRFEIKEYKSRRLTFEVTEKLDGTSCTMFIKDGTFGVCSRNLELRFSETNALWRMALVYQVEERMRELGLDNIAFQGEVIGEGIQSNPYKIKGQDFFVFDVFDIKEDTYFDPQSRMKLVLELNLKHVPVIESSREIATEWTIDDMLQIAEAKSLLNPKTEREGLVWKCDQEPTISFKTISNKFLMKNG
jgi:RNA ligase (TIGR02306 family)